MSFVGAVGVGRPPVVRGNDVQEAFPKLVIASPWTINRGGRPRGENWRPRNTGRGQQCGERRRNSSLTRAIVLRIRELRRTGIGAVRISRELADDGIKVKSGAVQAVINGDTWRHVK